MASLTLEAAILADLWFVCILSQAGEVVYLELPQQPGTFFFPLPNGQLSALLSGFVHLGLSDRALHTGG
jgi:hypothetical protein